MKRRWILSLFRRRVFVIFLLAAQIVFLAYVISSGSTVSTVLDKTLRFLSFLAVLYIIAKKDKGAYKTTWVVLILSLPLLGGFLYLLFNFQSSTRRFSKRIAEAEEKSTPLYALPGDGYAQAEKTLGHQFPQVRYLQNYTGFPVYANTGTQYLSPGEQMFEKLLEELDKARRYIFLEFFIVQEGIMWNSILSILKEKARQGVTVRLMYDDMGCFFLLPKDYPKQLAESGIECVLFNPFRPFLTAKQNNRDHRKIVSIDGKTVFTGGVNLADEYINKKEKHGHWKDAGIMIQGKAAWSFTLMFLEMWELCTGKNEDFRAFYPWQEKPCDVPSDGFVQPYADSPMDTENVGEHVYLQILEQAQNYVYINTPYLIVDDSVLSALMLAAKRGVDVRIVTPQRWDKKFVHLTMRSYYLDLIKAGVKVYEYENGFIHAKTFVSDDTVATVGTTNLDFRSLYLHFECGAVIFHAKTVADIKNDFLTTLNRCRQIYEKDCQRGFFMRLFQNVLRLFAPLM